MKATHYLALTALLVSMSSFFTSCIERGNYNTYPNNGNNTTNDTKGGINPGYPAEFDEQFNGADKYGWSFTDAADSAYAGINNGSYQYVDYSTIQSNMSTVNTGINTQINFT